MRRRRDLQRHIFYTEPATPVAGQAVSLFYNSDLTSLRGRPEVWLRGSHNRWAHPQRFGPVQMHSVVKGGVGFHKAQIEVRPFVPRAMERLLKFQVLKSVVSSSKGRPLVATPGVTSNRYRAPMSTSLFGLFWLHSFFNLLLLWLTTGL